MSVVERGTAKLNLYDLFSNFLPGAILLVGVFLPIVGPQQLFTDVGLGSLVLIAVLAFAAGLIVQVIGGEIASASSHFEEQMEQIVTDQDEEGKDIEEITEADVRYLEGCRVEFGLSADFSDWSRLFKMTLARLEESPRSRAIRIQALFLAMRGMMVTTAILSVYFGATALLVWNDSISSELPPAILLALAVLSLVSAVLFYIRQDEFGQDLCVYMIDEFNQGIE